MEHHNAMVDPPTAERLPARGPKARHDLSAVVSFPHDLLIWRLLMTGLAVSLPEPTA
jgi:hypothetical protein